VASGGRGIVVPIVVARTVALLAAGSRVRLVASRLWEWLATCAESGCARRPVHLGWCDEHAPVSDSGPDEYWGDLDGRRS
jgi:hypothetical protein